MTDLHRPRFHFTAPSGWLNDPNGLTQRDGRFHLFYQHNPDAPIHDQVHWGHASSTDLVHWRHEPIALSPSPGADERGCWSGVVVDADGVPTMIYSGNSERGQRCCLAVGDESLTTWTKVPGNPVIPEPPEGLDLVAYRDHCVWRADDGWHQLMGAGLTDRGGLVLHYRSADLRSWEYVGPLAEAADLPADTVWTGSVWECPDLFRLGGRHVLLVSAWDRGTHHSVYLIGELDDGRFRPAVARLLDHGLRHFYAPQSLGDAQGRRIVFGWIQEARGREADLTAGWSGVMSLPRELRLVEDRLVLSPVVEVERLRGEHARQHARDLGTDEPVEIAPNRGDRLDLELRLIMAPGSAAELELLATPDRAERTTVRITSDTVALDRSRSSLAAGLDLTPLACPVDPAVDGSVGLRVLVDRSVIELFVNGRALTARAYPTRADATGTRLSLRDGTVRLDRLDSWTMAAAQAV